MRLGLRVLAFVMVAVSLAFATYGFFDMLRGEDARAAAINAAIRDLYRAEYDRCISLGGAPVGERTYHGMKLQRCDFPPAGAK